MPTLTTRGAPSPRTRSRFSSAWRSDVNGLPVLSAPAHSAPRVAFRELRSVWFQITGTRCNLACRHCFNASGPRDPWLSPLGVDVVHRHLAEAEALGVRDGAWDVEVRIRRTLSEMK